MLALQPHTVTVRKRSATLPTAAQLDMTIFDPAASQSDGPCHGHDTPYHDYGVGAAAAFVPEMHNGMHALEILGVLVSAIRHKYIALSRTVKPGTSMYEQAPYVRYAILVPYPFRCAPERLLASNLEVIPAQAGIQRHWQEDWIPAGAGMTAKVYVCH
jgi:hypothetical protein